MIITITDPEVCAAIRAAAKQDSVTPSRVVQECLQYMVRTGQVLLNGTQTPGQLAGVVPFMPPDGR